MGRKIPNWCSNFVQITHTDPAKIAALAEAAADGRFCNAVRPCPAILHDHTAPEMDEDRAKEFIEKYGAADWYTWQVNNWGTKWDVDPQGIEVSEDGSHLSFAFDSAWSPPIAIYEALQEDGYTVDAMYYEPGMGFCGRWTDGYDDTYDLGGLTADQVEESIDPDVDA